MSKAKAQAAESIEEAAEVKTEEVAKVEEVAAPVDVTETQEVRQAGTDEPKKRFVVLFNPSTPIGERARRMEVEAVDVAEAEAIWRRETGFAGNLGAQLVINEVAPAEGV